jgi:hypothetical protein
VKVLSCPSITPSPPSPIKGEGEKIQIPSPLEGEGGKILIPSPLEGEGEGGGYREI